MNTTLRYLIVAVIAMSIGFFTMQWFSKPAQTAASPLSNASSASSSRSLKEPVLVLPDFSLKDRDGKMTSIRSWPGKSLIVNFWATWCEPCRREMPLLAKIQQEHGKDGFQVVGIAIDFRDQVVSFMDQMHLTYPILMGEQDGMEAADAFGVEASGLPFTVFMDAKGNIITTHLGELHRDQAKLILDTIQQVNDGKLAVEAARTHINTALNATNSR
jgi:thiol-disulfide isomerase/thioredoxin